MKTAFALILVASGAFAAELPADLQAPGASPLFVVHAVGAQVYECKAGADGTLAWSFREPIASLFEDGKTIGRHYAGPTWEIGGSAIVGKVTGHAPGATARDIPWLKLTVAEKRGDGPLKDAVFVRRINTSGGVRTGACESAGSLVAEPYAADYEFLKD